MGTIALVGGNEFRNDCKPMDLWLLEHILTKPAKVVIVPTAAAQEGPRVAAYNGIHYFRALGATASEALILDKNGAQDPQQLTHLEEADLIYLTGGSPWLLLNILCNTPVVDAFKRALKRGAAIVGSSAGAMALAEKMREVLAAGWMDGLNIVKGVAVLPHYNRKGEANYEPLRHALDPHIAILGIEEATGCVRLNNSNANNTEWHVIGLGSVTVYMPDQGIVYKSGETFTLPTQR